MHSGPTSSRSMSGATGSVRRRRSTKSNPSTAAGPPGGSEDGARRLRNQGRAGQERGVRGSLRDRLRLVPAHRARHRGGARGGPVTAAKRGRVPIGPQRAFSCPVPLYHRAVAAAIAQGVTVTEFIRRALTREVTISEEEARYRAGEPALFDGED